MDMFLDINRWTHIVVGFVGLAAFWVPVFARKGGPAHRAAGKVFRYSAMIVVSAAGLAVVLHCLRALIEGHSVSAHPAGWSFLVFLGYLALVTGGILSHGFGVLREKRDLTALNTPYRRGTAWAMIGSSIFIIGWGLYWQPPNAILLYALSPIGIGNGLGILAVLDGRRAGPGQWKLEHLNALLGCGIAFHTAFAVFGMSRFLPVQLPGAWQVLPWILPAAIGIPASIIWTRYYRRRAAPAAA